MTEFHSDNVVDLPVVTKLEVPPSKILADAAGSKLQDAVVIGWDKNGAFYFASSNPDASEVNWLLDCAKSELMEAGKR